MKRDTYEVIDSNGTKADTYEASSRESAVRKFRDDYIGKLVSNGGQVTVHAYLAGDASSERIPFVVTQDSVERL